MCPWVCTTRVCMTPTRLITMLSTDQIQELLWSLRRVYREQNSYHNFQHAVDVLQATHHMLLTAGRVPPVSLLLGDGAAWTPNPDKVDPLVACLDPLDLFCLYVASIGHDVAHPGLTNTFMVRFDSRMPWAPYAGASAT